MPLQTGSQLLMYQSFVKLADRSEGHAACMACWRGMHNSFCTAVDSCDHHLDMHLNKLKDASKARVSCMSKRTCRQACLLKTVLDKQVVTTSLAQRAS